jgi:predicted nucleic-acid-binding Zn-ribbon protein
VTAARRLAAYTLAMHKIGPCPNCGSTQLYKSPPVSAGGGHAPNFLPQLGGVFRSARFEVVLCRDCGLTRFFAVPDARSKLSSATKWRQV